MTPGNRKESPIGFRGLQDYTVHMPTFRQLVFALVVCVPSGKVTSYGRLAAALGQPRKAREVGWALSSIPENVNLNAHRVVGRDGSLSGGWAFGAPEVQRALLEQEGVRFRADGRVDLDGFLWPESAARSAALELLKDEPHSTPALPKGAESRKAGT
jgi:methylated-DNA-protein-cysteine methyltransferase-like protein